MLYMIWIFCLHVFKTNPLQSTLTLISRLNFVLCSLFRVCMVLVKKPKGKQEVTLFYDSYCKDLNAFFLKASLTICVKYWLLPLMCKIYTGNAKSIIYNILTNYEESKCRVYLITYRNYCCEII